MWLTLAIKKGKFDAIAAVASGLAALLRRRRR